MLYIQDNRGNKIIALVQGIAEFYKAPLFSFHIIDISIGVIAALLIKCAVYVRGKNAKKYRNGIEYGSRAGARRQT